MAAKTYSAGVKEYRHTYWTPEYTPLDTDLLAVFKVTLQPGVDREEAAAAVAAESSAGTWTDVDYCKGLACRTKDVPVVGFVNFGAMRMPGRRIVMTALPRP